MEVNGKTRTLGLFGNPVAHTYSPFIQNLLAQYMEINSVYMPFKVDEGKLSDAVNGAKAMNFLGNNVTVPYKVDVINYMDVLDENAEMIGAVNTIKYTNGLTYGYNTDGEGLIMSCKKSGIAFKDKTVCILGAGGAAKAVAVACAKVQVKKIYIINRTIEKAKVIAEIIKKYFNTEVIVADYNQLEALKPIDICFQTTSIGMHPNVEACPITDNSFFENMEWAVDIIYNPCETRFLKQAKEMGISTLNGLGMLYFQAVKAFEIWNDTLVPEEIVDIIYQKFYNHVYET